MKKLASITLTALLISGCVTRIVEVEEGESIDLQITRESTTTTPSTASPTTTKPVTVVTVPPATVRANSTNYTADLNYITGYCYSTCNRMYPETWERFLALSTSNGLNAAVGTMAELSYSEIDSICEEFWARTDSSVINSAANEFGISDTNALMATLYYVCDT